MDTTAAPTTPGTCTRLGDHEPHYLGRDHRGVPQRCPGVEEDWATTGQWWRETGWTGL